MASVHISGPWYCEPLREGHIVVLHGLVTALAPPPQLPDAARRQELQAFPSVSTGLSIERSRIITRKPHLRQPAHAAPDPTVPKHHSVRPGPVRGSCGGGIASGQLGLATTFSLSGPTQGDGLGVQEGVLQGLKEVLQRVVAVGEGLNLPSHGSEPSDPDFHSCTQ
jgi:hypothetical protein